MQTLQKIIQNGAQKGTKKLSETYKEKFRKKGQKTVVWRTQTRENSAPVRLLKINIRFIKEDYLRRQTS